MHKKLTNITKWFCQKYSSLPCDVLCHRCISLPTPSLLLPSWLPPLAAWLLSWMSNNAGGCVMLRQNWGVWEEWWERGFSDLSLNFFFSKKCGHSAIFQILFWEPWSLLSLSTANLHASQKIMFSRDFGGTELVFLVAHGKTRRKSILGMIFFGTEV